MGLAPADIATEDHDIEIAVESVPHHLFAPQICWASPRSVRDQTDLVAATPQLIEQVDRVGIEPCNLEDWCKECS